MSASARMVLPLPSMSSPNVRWFSGRGCVVRTEEGSEVWVGGTLVGSFGPRDRGVRNALLVGLAEDPKMHLGRLAEAFEVSDEGLRLLRRAYARGGLEAIVSRVPGGSEAKVTASLRSRLEKLFERGMTVAAAHAAVSRRGKIGRSTVGKVRKAWALGRARAAVAAAATHAAQGVEDKAPELPFEAALPRQTEPQGNEVGEEAPLPEAIAVAEPITAGSAEEEVGAYAAIESASVQSGRSVQHLGTWVLVAVVAQLGLYRRAMALCEERVDGAALRVALDAVVMALGIGQGCVEGVRRLATPSAGKLLRADHAPSASWARRVLGRFSSWLGGVRLHLGMACEYIDQARAAAEQAVVFYVDNHLRPYTGGHTVRRGWRMQDKRVRPGATDYYVHDQDGRPVLRVDVPSHGSLTEWLSPIGRVLQQALPEDRILLAFDRAGAFAEPMAELRDAGFEFVTYERRPFPLLAESAFEQTVDFDDETLSFTESRTNLGAGRGRVRRIAVRTPQGRQVNLVGVSDQPPERLIAIMRGRWVQENGFKHGVERWGINQLDGRKTAPYAPDTIVPNPARRRLDHAIRIAAASEGQARCKLAELSDDDPRRAPLLEQIEQALTQQRELRALRPSTPNKAPLKDTELAADLVKHTSEYKTTLDTIRIACANAEADLAGELAPRLDRPAEAKKAIANLFAAPGHIRVHADGVRVTLFPAGTLRERAALAALLRSVSQRRLALPGDPRARPLRFQSQL